MMRTGFLALTAAVLAAGCAPLHQPQGFLGKLWRLEVGPHYERPAVDTQLSLARYHTGLTNYIEVLDAEELLYPAESALAQTPRDQLIAVVNLYKALGGGWQLQEEQVAAR